MIVYSAKNCPQCVFLKQRLKEKGLTYTEEQDVEIMRKEGVTALPAVKLDDGRLLRFAEALKYMNEVQ